MKRRALSMFLSTIMAVGLLAPMGSMTALAATSSEGLTAAESVKADVDKTKFTHKEWTGTDYTDVDGNEVTGEDVFGIAREDASVPRIPYQTTAAAADAVWDYDARENSTYFDLLTGEDETWELTVVQNQTEAEKFMAKADVIVDDFSKNNLDTALPGTAQYVNGEGQKSALKGYFSVNDPEKVISEAMTGGKAFTVASRVYVPASVKSSSTGVFEGNTKHNMIASIGDNSFAYRVFYNKNNGEIRLDAFISDGSSWNSIYYEDLGEDFFDQWHDIAVSYEGAVLTLFVDGVAVESLEGTANIYNSKEAFAVGYEPQKSDRKSELTFEQVVVYDEALTEEDFATEHSAEDENVILWLDFNYAEKQSEESAGFMDADFVKDPADGWKDITLPMSWTREGQDFDFSIYTNTQMPWQSKYDSNVSVPNAPTNYNPVGLYRKTFTVSEEMRADNRRIYISFQGVESAYYVYVNGKEVGYSEDSYSPHRFDITDYLIEGENLLAVKVHKFCDGTWFEDQDMIYDGGIFRDVYLTSEPLVKIEDYVVTTDLDENYEDAVLSVSVDVRNLSTKGQSGWTVDVQAFDEAGKDILGGASIPVSEVASTETATFAIDIDVEKPELWSAEKPNLYALVLTLKDGEGNVVENLSAQLGFREIEFTSTEVDSNYNVTTKKWEATKINGQRLLLKGANRHDSDPIYGKAVPQATMFEDVKLMKQYNLNAVRTSHYSNDEYFYWLCNKYGLYMMGETNMECHAITGNESGRALFYELGMDRTETTFKRLRNNPAIVMWSIGNEMGYTSSAGNSGGLFRDMIWYFKNNDPTRPVHSEGQNDKMGTDMGSNMYPSVDTVWGRAGEDKIPYVLCEYVHAMGNSVGNLEEYWDAIRSSDNMLGAFVWDWVDQARAIDLEELGVTYSVTDKTGVKGEVFGDETDWMENAGEGSLNGGHSFSGYTLFSDAKYNAALSGTGKSFTFEAIVKPASASQNSVLIAKGDTQAALKTKSSGSGLEFFVYSDGNWNAVSCNFPSDWVGNWHQVVGVYEKGQLTIYVDGTQMATKTVTDAIASNSYKLGVGYDQQNGRKVDGEISIARIYSKALTAEEIQAQNSATPAIGPDDASVLLWMDYSEEVGEAELAGWDYYSEEYAHQNLYEDEMDGKFFGYGGDWGDRPNDNSFCQNGLLSADRNPQPELYEVKYQYQNLWFSADIADLDAGKVKVYNENNFTNVSEYDLTWELLENGIVIETGKIEGADVAPLTEGTVNVPFTMPKDPKAGNEYYLNISAALKETTDWAEAGHELSWEQIKVPVEVAQAQRTISDKEVTVTDTAEAYEVKGENFSFNIRKADGILENYVYGGETLVETGPAPNFWRGKVENDKSGFDGNWENAEKNIEVEAITAEVDEETGLHVITAELVFPDAGNTKETIVYTVNGEGQITIDMTVDATKSGMGNFLRIGSLSVLPAGFEHVTWYGNGPVETFNDRQTNARQGVYENTVNGFFYPYEKVDDTGTLTDVVWMKIQNDKLNNALLVAAENYVEASTLHFTPDDLNAVTHPYELDPREETILSINYGSMGTGGATCGPATLEQYRFPSSVVYNWAFTLMPVAADADAAEVYEAAREYHVIDAFSRTEYDQEKANELIERIDSFVVYDYSQLAEVQDLADDLAVMNEAQAALVGEARVAKASKYLEEVKALEGKTAYILDASKNAIQIPYEETAQFFKEGDNVLMSGYLTVPENDSLYGALEGKNSFTIEVNAIPTGDISYNMFAGKGDYAFALRCRGTSSVDFHIYAGGSWRALEYAMTAEESAAWLNQKHQIVGMYDAEQDKLQLYVDGVFKKEVNTNTTSGTEHSEYNFMIGACPDTGRTSAVDFDDIRVYNKALTAEEVAGQYAEEPAITADHEAVELWVDFEELASEEVPADPPVQTKPVTEVFADVKETDWFVPHVQYVYDNGIMSGNDATGEFTPNSPLLRQQFVRLLWNLEGQPKVDDNTAFEVLKDADPNAYYADALRWAYSEGIMTGVGGEYFKGGEPVKRQQLAKMLYEYAEKKGYDVSVNADYSGMENADKISDYAVKYMGWAVGTGMITGKGGTDLAPLDTATRAQIAKIIQVFCETYEVL